MSKTQQQQDLQKKIMPNGKASWRKRGGYAGKKTIVRTVEKAEKLGFEEVDTKAYGSATGAGMGTGEVYRHPSGATLEVGSSYGYTSKDNCFWMDFEIKN